MAGSLKKMIPILEVKNLTMDFGGLCALDRLELDVAQGEIVALIGPNGAGKTTFFNCITGIYDPREGDMLISPPGDKGDAKKQERINVLENVMIGRHCRTSSGIVGAVFRGKSTVKEEKEVVEDSYNILKKIGLSPFVNEFAKNLPYGAQRRLEIARAMATEPFLLLLDEPAAGMNLQETRELAELIMRIRDREHISILLIEHDMKLVMNLSDRIFVMDYGRKIAQGTPAKIRNNPVVIKAYLGDEEVILSSSPGEEISA